MTLEDPQFVKSLVEVSHIEFQSYDSYHRHLICSSGLAQKILGYTKEEYYSLSHDFYKEIIHPDDWQDVSAHLDKLLQSAPGEIIDMTYRVRRSDGNYLWIYSRKMVMQRDKDGNPLTITNIVEDISDFIELENQLREKVQKLESISYMNSHMVRGPVASIIGLVHLIEEKEITSAHNMQVFNYLKDALQKLDNLIHDINDLSRT